MSRLLWLADMCPHLSNARITRVFTPAREGLEIVDLGNMHGLERACNQRSVQHEAPKDCGGWFA